MKLSLQDSYGEELTDAVNTLNAHSLLTSIRGDGIGRFLLVETTNRSVEISRSGEKVFVEFFEGEEHVKDDYVNDFQTAILRTVDWLKK